MNGVQTRFKCKLDVKRCKRFVFPPSSLLPRSNALKTKAIRYFQTDRTLTRIVSPPLKAADFDQNSLLVFIEAERRRELCLEGHRWFDLRRTTRPAMERIGYENQVARLEKDDPRYVLQIPKRELSVNPGIGSNPR